MKIIVKMLFGSRVYGTNLPTSDTDYKQVFLSSFDDMALFKGKRITASTSSAGKNTSEDIDMESIELGRFLDLCMQGQTNAIDMLFTPEEFWIESSPIWDRVIELKPHLLNRKIKAMVGYCRSQASRYSVKGDRLNDVEAAIDLFERLPPEDRLELHIDALGSLCSREHIELREIEVGTGDGKKILALTVCGRYLPMTTRIGYSLDNVLYPAKNKHGRRARAAADADGADYKAMMHALRVAGEAIELMRTGNITMPLLDRSFLLEVRKGDIPAKEVSNEIDNRLELLEKAVENSSLPEESNREKIEEFIINIYKEHFGVTK